MRNPRPDFSIPITETLSKRFGTPDTIATMTAGTWMIFRPISSKRCHKFLGENHTLQHPIVPDLIRGKTTS